VKLKSILVLCTFAAIVAGIVAYSCYQYHVERSVSAATTEAETTTEPERIPALATGSHIYWDTRYPMLGFLSSTDTDAYDSLVLAVNAASSGSKTEKYGYGPGSISSIQMSKLLKAENYVQSFGKTQSDQSSVMVPLLRKMRENLGNVSYDKALEVLVTSTWYDNADYYQLHQDKKNDQVKSAMIGLLGWRSNDYLTGNRALICINLPWRETSKALFILVVGNPKKVFAFCESVVAAIEKESIKLAFIMSDYSCEEPQFLDTTDIDVLPAKLDGGDGEPRLRIRMELINCKGVFLEPVEIRESDGVNISLLEGKIHRDGTQDNPFVGVKDPNLPAVVKVMLPFRIGPIEQFHLFTLTGLKPKDTQIKYQIEGLISHSIAFPEIYNGGDVPIEIKIPQPQIGAKISDKKCTISIELVLQPDTQTFFDFIKDANKQDFANNPEKTYNLSHLFLDMDVSNWFTGKSIIQTAECSFVIRGAIA